MKQVWSSSWKSSIQPRKQKKYIYNAPMHVRRTFLGVHLSKELRQKYGTRSITLRKGDKIKVLRGSHKNHVGKVERVDAKNLKVYITGIEMTKKDGSKRTPPLRPSNLMIIELDLSDKKRDKSLKRKGVQAKKKEAPKAEVKQTSHKTKEIKG